MIDEPAFIDPRAAVPEAEIELVCRQIRAHPEILDPEHVAGAYRALGLEVLPDPFGPEVVARIRAALLAGRPCSVIRIGDAEANLLAYRACAETPHLDRRAFAASVYQNRDSFTLSESWALVVRDLLLGAVLRADIVGVLGLWMPTGAKTGSTESIVAGFLRDHRGYAGQWRGRRHMLRLAQEGLLRGRIVASAHLYFSVVRHVHELVAESERVICITDNDNVVGALRRCHAGREIRQIPVARPRDPGVGRLTEPLFLGEVDAELPRDLGGCLCLVGAGPWAEVYCAWIRDRGGVGVDIGSGFDLLEGKPSRPVHHRVGTDVTAPLAIGSTANDGGDAGA